ncbi:hypothetical protein ACFC1T_27770 [Kitasatospora sp. NPDC056076]|uniref:hypothetical protein n=1 Tax=Kitasatospora sp. NPDC056076 TaxID=3345703 RepID=UPI0035E27C1A
MGYELRRQLREALGPQVTGLQRAVALEIADDANEETRKSWAALEDLARWAGAKDTSVVRNALKRLAVAGWEFRIPIGKGKDGRALYAVPGVRMTFLVPPFEGVAVAPPFGGKGEHGLPLEGATATPSDPQGGAGAHSEGATAHSEGAGAPPFSSYPSDPSTDKDSPRREGRAPATPSPAKPKVDHHLEAFGAFWLVYPKKKAREEAKKAWCAAIERGADPQHLVNAATAYARERANEDPQYTKHPATWLNKGCYDDEPDTAAGQRPPLRAVSGNDWQPYSNPDPSVYKNGWTS